MNILYLSFSKIPSRDANSVHVMNMAHALSQLGHKVRLVVKGRPSPVGTTEYDYYGVPQSFDLVKVFSPEIPLFGDIVYGALVGLRLLDPERPQLIYGRHPHLVAVASLLKIPVVYEVHDLPPSPFRRWLEARIFKADRFRKLVVISGSLKEAYLRQFPFLGQDRVIVAHDGARLPTKSIGQDQTVARLPGRGTVTKVGYTGHLYQGRGIELIVQLAARLSEVDFYLVGGSQEDLVFWRRQDLPSNLYLLGFVPPQKIPSYLAQFDILVAPYQLKVASRGGRGDTSKWMSPLKIFEYMAAAKPILVSDLPVLREVLADAQTALMLPPDRVDDWAESIKELAGSPDLRNRLGAAARNTLEQQFTWNERARLILTQIS